MSKLDKTLPKNATNKVGDHPSIISIEGDVQRFCYF
jgi:hypothetical protein